MKNFNPKALMHTALFFTAIVAAAHGGQGGNFLVQLVVPDSAASAAGLQKGDSILQIGEQPMKTQADLDKVLDTHGPGDTVPLLVERGGEKLDLELTFHERPGGGPSIGVSVSIVGEGGGSGKAFSGPTLTREECVAWIDNRYHIATRASELGKDFLADAKALVSCHKSNIQGMPSPMPVGWCDNAFKIHCSAVGLLTEIGEAQVEGCEKMLGEKLSSCASQKVFDRYSKDGQVSDRAACSAAQDSCSESPS
jgi:membrane-associated protease RseP (regulator of RpoE activity)